MEFAPDIAIVDYCAGNLFSVTHACKKAGLNPIVTSSSTDLLKADAVMLPGVGAFGEAMGILRERDLTSPLRDVAQSGKPLIGICLGMQLFMSESQEFGVHRGLDLIEGSVVAFEFPQSSERVAKVPHVGWNRIQRPAATAETESKNWQDPLLDNVNAGEHMYFVHSFYAQPHSAEVILSLTEYGGVTFCSSLRQDNIWAFQFHPEKSGPTGIRIYENIANLLRQQISCREQVHAA